MVMRPPLLVIVGPTGVGKTAVAVRLGRRLALEIVSADSRQVYQGMDVGTGKPTPAERAAVKHHLLDLIRPDERYHAARFRREALEAIGDIRAREKLPASKRRWYSSTGSRQAPSKSAPQAAAATRARVPTGPPRRARSGAPPRASG